eukprot:1457832-Pyramimonas_sp.AAC.1
MEGASPISRLASHLRWLSNCCRLWLQLHALRASAEEAHLSSPSFARSGLRQSLSGHSVVYKAAPEHSSVRVSHLSATATERFNLPVRLGEWSGDASALLQRCPDVV